MERGACTTLGAMERSVKPILALNIICAAAGALGLLISGDFQTFYFLSMLTVTGFVLISAGLEDVRMTPTGTQIRRALFKSGHPYSPERHKEALETANVMVAVGGILLAEMIGISLALAIGGL
jgi:hypothetical protein